MSKRKTIIGSSVFLAFFGAIAAFVASIMVRQNDEINRQKLMVKSKVSDLNMLENRRKRQAEVHKQDVRVWTQINNGFNVENNQLKTQVGKLECDLHNRNLQLVVVLVGYALIVVASLLAVVGILPWC